MIKTKTRKRRIFHFILFEIVPRVYAFINASDDSIDTNCDLRNTDEKCNNSSGGNSLGERHDDREKLTNDWKYSYNPFNISRNSVSFSEDKVRANILYNESIMNKNVKVIFEEEAGTFMALYKKSMIVCY